jgi:acyl-CoA dehydrogenase
MASVVARLSHQLHGAIGFTQEHPLHFSTTRLTSWRQDDLSETACALELARLVPGLGGPWVTLTARRLG